MTQPPHSTLLSNHSDASLDVLLWLDPHMLSGESVFVRHLVTGLKSEGHRVSFIAPSHLDISALPTLGSRVCTYRWNRWERVGVLQRLRLSAAIEEFSERPADVLLTWGSAEALPVEIFLHATAIPTVVWCWDGSELTGPMARSRHVRHLIVSAEPIRQRVPAEVRTPVTLIRPGVYTDDLTACFDVEGQLACIVSLDPLAEKAAYEALLHACRMLTDEKLEFLLFAYDQGRQEHPIWRTAEKLGLLDRLSFVPFQQEAEPLLLHGDLFLHVLPTSRVLYRTLEAMGKGLAVVSSPNHGADYLLDGQTCRVVRDSSPGAWHGVLAELLRDRPAATALARRGQQYVREHHGMTPMLTQLMAVCRQAAGVAIKMGGA